MLVPIQNFFRMSRLLISVCHTILRCVIREVFLTFGHGAVRSTSGVHRWMSRRISTTWGSHLALMFYCPIYTDTINKKDLETKNWFNNYFNFRNLHYLSKINKTFKTLSFTLRSAAISMSIHLTSIKTRHRRKLNIIRHILTTPKEIFK